MVISTDVRGLGVGRALSSETFALALSIRLEKLVVQMTVDQTGAIAIFEGLGFRAGGAAARPCEGSRRQDSATSSCSGTMWRR